MRYFPAFVDVDRAAVLVVGGAESAAQKVRLLRKTRATVRVVAPALNDELRQLAADSAIDWVEQSFRPEHLQGCRLVFATTGERVVDAGVAFAARSRSIPVNVVDVPQLCTFITPAIVDRDPVLVAIGTEGAAPVLAQKIKSMLEAWLPARLGDLTAFARRQRQRVMQAVPAGGARRHFWRRFFDGEISRLFLAGDHAGSEAALARALQSGEAYRDQPGQVALVGAGPGDPDLLTFKAARLLQDADVIVVDQLVHPSILEIARRDARRIFVGKQPGHHSVTQNEINTILEREALAGHKVVRLKGGDPLIFGRAAEEMAALQSAGIAIEIVPGVTSALAAAASAGALLTERDERRALTLMTGHASDGPAEHDWAALARPGQSLAIYMGVGAAARIQGQLLTHGIDPATPVTIVENAASSNERSIQGRIDGLASLITASGIQGPAIIFIGARATLAQSTAIHTEKAA